MNSELDGRVGRMGVSRGKAAGDRGRLKDHRETETWLVRPSRGAGLRVGLVYPSSYYVGMSSLGYQLIYRLLAARNDLLVERLFDPGPGHRPRSVESERPAADFDVLAFSCAYEPEYVGLIRFLLQSGIEPLAERRRAPAPLLLAGGIAVSANPAPLARLLDGILLGDGEELVGAVFDRLAGLDLRSAGREAVLAQLSDIDSVYLPALHDAPPERTLTRHRVEDLDAFPTGSAVLTRHTDLSEMFLVETARGCARRCRFCLTGHSGGRLRLRSIGKLLQQVEAVRDKIRKVGLIASEVACHPGLAELCESLVAKGLAISTSSLEIDRVDRALLDLLVRGGQRTLTLAPETGDERQRFELGKKISNEQLFDLAANAAEAGIERLKLYFIIGMPHTDEAEVEVLLVFLRQAREAFFRPGRRRRKALIASVAPFVPKPHTPWAFEPMLSERESRQRLARLRREAGRLGAVRITSQSPLLSSLDAMIGLGDCAVGPILTDALLDGASPRGLARRLREFGIIDPFHPRSPSDEPAWKKVG